jgi:hypothetical protein
MFQPSSPGDKAYGGLGAVTKAQNAFGSMGLTPGPRKGKVLCFVIISMFDAGNSTSFDFIAKEDQGKAKRHPCCRIF